MLHLLEGTHTKALWNPVAALQGWTLNGRACSHPSSLSARPHPTEWHATGGNQVLLTSSVFCIILHRIVLEVFDKQAGAFCFHFQAAPAAAQLSQIPAFASKNSPTTASIASPACLEVAVDGDSRWVRLIRASDRANSVHRQWSSSKKGVIPHCPGGGGGGSGLDTSSSSKTNHTPLLHAARCSFRRALVACPVRPGCQALDCTGQPLLSGNAQAIINSPPYHGNGNALNRAHHVITTHSFALLRL